MLDPILSPRSVAVIGAGRDRASMSGRIYRNLRDRFRGPVYAVNPRAATIDGARAFASLLDVPGPVDLAFVAVRAANVLETVRHCVKKEVRGLVVISAGYSETGASGRERQHELLNLVRAARIPMVGPNSFGVINADPAVALEGVFSPIEPPWGNVAFASQSGAVGVVIPDLLKRGQIGLSSFVSIGNKADVGENDLLVHWEHDSATRVIALYLESFQDPSSFLEHARRISRKKPIVALKAGRTQAGKRAAQSHTAALASQDAAADALFQQSGVIRAETLEELFDIAALLASQPVPAGPRVAVLGNAGGPGVLCADVLESEGLSIPEFSSCLQESLRAALPPGAAVQNPVDLIGTIDAELYRRSLGAVLKSDEVDAMIAIYVPRESGTLGAVADAVRVTAAAAGIVTPVLGVFMQTEAVCPSAGVAGAAIPAYVFPESAARALARAAAYGRWLQTSDGRYPSFPEVDPLAARRLVDSSVERAPARQEWLDTATVQRLLAASGLSVPRWAVVHSADEAAAVATRWEAPVVVKAIDPRVLHKTDAGVVALDLRGEDDVRRAYRQIADRAPAACGMLVQEYVPLGYEVLIGVTRDPAFGPLIGCGPGGTLVELAGGAVFRLHPLTDRDAAELIDGGRLGQILRGYRGRPAADRAALSQTLLRVSALVALFPEVLEMDLNPVLVLPGTGGALVVDARIRVRRAGITARPPRTIAETCPQV
jgi:acyl-CoA synthetase (NDP forming)